ncbi:MAG: pesticidal protein Cry7Aa [Patescibacteria group bacterium]|nr:pesticidal protein Cry7Aa [Patescibacteria group bacterium]
MLKVKKEGVILKPTKNKFESRAVLNPGVYQAGDDVHIIYRAINRKYVSSLGYARLSGPMEIAERWDKPFMFPTRKEESQGVEDARLVKIDNTFYLTYVVHDGKNAITAYSYGEDLFKLKRGGIISPKIQYKDAVKMFRYSKLKDAYYFFESFYQQFGGRNILIWHKDVFLFPEKIDSKFWLMHRILPDIQLTPFEDFSELKDKFFWIFNLMRVGEQVLLEGEHGFESRHVGGGAPPVKTKAGWLIIYHSTQGFNKKRTYYASAALLDLKNPRKVIGRLSEPLFSPTRKFELEGTVNDVVFPTGTAIFDDRLYIYYGAADTTVAVASVKLDDLINTLLKRPR